MRAHIEAAHRARQRELRKERGAMTALDVGCWDLVIVGGGNAALCAAIEAAEAGRAC
jgi:ribulose 1,5-bisphosphate synthetase/thiazole synthase